MVASIYLGMRGRSLLATLSPFASVQAILCKVIYGVGLTVSVLMR